MGEFCKKSSAEMSNKTKDELMNANGRTLLANWVEERATLHIDSDVDRKDILKRGHKNIITGEPYHGANYDTNRPYLRFSKKRSARKPINSGNQSNEQILLFQDHHLHQLMEFNGSKKNQLVFGLSYTRKNELMDAQLVKRFRNQPNSQLQSFTKWMIKIMTFHIRQNNCYYFYS